MANTDTGILEPSALPWVAHDDDGTGTLPCLLSARVNAFGNFYAAQCNQFADALLIARAVNSHAALVEALRRMTTHFPCGHKKPVDGCAGCASYAALALADGAQQ